MTKTSLFAGLVLLFSAASANPIIIDGYTDRSSAFPGDSVGLHLHATAAYQDFTVNLFDLRGKIVHTNTIHVFPQKIQSRAFESGFGYIRSANVAVPYLPSGVYLWENKIPFIIKHPNPRIIVIYPSNTESAYNNAGGKSLYGFNSTDQKGATIVSFHRPAGIERFSEAFLRWMHTENNMEVGYIADIDMDRYAEIKKANLLIIPGHSEYWTLSARKNFDRFVENGNSAMVLSGNTMWWQVRYSDKRDKLICYRNIESDKGSPAKLKTINWNDPLLDYPILRSLGTDFSYAGYGAKVDKGWDGYKIIANSPLLVGTGIKVGDILPLRSQEADGAPLRGFQVSTKKSLERNACLHAQPCRLSASCRVASPGSVWQHTAEITATPCAPAFITSATVSSSMPPIAIISSIIQHSQQYHRQESRWLPEPLMT
jgi:hypothetical protein